MGLPDLPAGSNVGRLFIVRTVNTRRVCDEPIRQTARPAWFWAGDPL